MDTEDHSIPLSGPFEVVDSLGRTWQVKGIRIYDEGYSIIDVYVDFAEPVEDEPLCEDAAVMRQILARLRNAGYDGPEFDPSQPAMHDDTSMVLEAPEAFIAFAIGKGWRNLAEDFAEAPAHSDEVAADADLAHGGPTGDPSSHQVYSDLMNRLRGK